MLFRSGGTAFIAIDAEDTLSTAYPSAPSKTVTVVLVNQQRTVTNVAPLTTDSPPRSALKDLGTPVH